MTDEQDGWEALRRVIDVQMTKLAIGPVELEARSGVSRETFRPILKGQPGNYRPATLAKLSRALELPPEHLGRLVGRAAMSDDLAAVRADRTESTDLASRVAALDPEDQRYIDGIIDALERKKRGS